MNVSLSLFALVVLAAGCTGYGSLFLTLFGAHRHLKGPLEWTAFSFVVGVGVFGWLLFFPGIWGFFEPASFWATAALGTVMIAGTAHRFRFRLSRPAFTWAGLCLVGLLCIALAFDLLEGLSPPADADTLAYHFALPKQFLAAGEVVFVARAVSGAIPLLLHMTYGAALGTGGELTLTLWAMLTGWAAALLLYVAARRHLSRDWAAALAIAFLTTPAVLYGGGNGQVEIRCAGFVLASVALLTMADHDSSLRLLLLAGLCAGFFMASKFFGLFFVGVAGSAVLCHRDGLRRALVFGTAALVAGFQWYLWNWIHTGDPVFPALTNLLLFPDSPIWTRDFGQYFTAFLVRGELPLDRSLFNWLAYPVLSTFNIDERIEGGRTGLGILVFILLPLAAAGFARRDLRRPEQVLPLVIAFLFFTVWFFSGTAQRTRHLLPVYPLVLVALFPIALGVARRTTLATPLAAGTAAVLAIQIAGQGIFTINYARYVFGPETRAQFMARNVPGANAAEWINRNLPADVKVAFMNRQLAYLIDRPSFMLHPHIQALIDARPSSGNERRFVAQSRRQKVTHFLLSEIRGSAGAAAALEIPFFGMIDRLIQSGCLRHMHSFDTVQIPSRTLRQFGGTETATKDAVFVLVPDRCPPPG